MTTYGPYPAKVVAIHDGDTCTLDIDLGFNIHFTSNCRFFGINAPELSTATGKAALAYLESIMPVGRAVVVWSEGWDKYGGRFDGAIFLAGSPGISVNDMMLDSGNAVKYP